MLYLSWDTLPIVLEIRYRVAQPLCVGQPHFPFRPTKTHFHRVAAFDDFRGDRPN